MFALTMGNDHCQNYIRNFFPTSPDKTFLVPSHLIFWWWTTPYTISSWLKNVLTISLLWSPAIVVEYSTRELGVSDSSLVGREASSTSHLFEIPFVNIWDIYLENWFIEEVTKWSYIWICWTKKCGKNIYCF